MSVQRKGGETINENETRWMFCLIAGISGLVLSFAAFLIGTCLIVAECNLPGALAILSAPIFLMLSIVSFGKIGGGKEKCKNNYPTYEDTL